MISKNILFINKNQFGYHTDYMMYCKYLKDDYVIVFICFDVGLKKINISGVEVKYVSFKGPKIIRGIRFIIRSILEIWFTNSIIFIHYFQKCYLLKILCPWKKMILDIRTLSVNLNKNIRNREDNKLKYACKYFDIITIISEGLRKKINLCSINSFILPLGSNSISNVPKSFNRELHLLYVGSLDGRNIDQSIIGLYHYLKESNYNTVSYDIIGDGNELSNLKKLVKIHGLDRIIKLHGRIPYFGLKPFLDKCNVGVSFVPITDYYDYQPVTKTFEYISSGLTCIATNTIENRKVINDVNGILCEDNSRSFTQALRILSNRFTKYNSIVIRNSLIGHEWSNIVNNSLKPILKKY